MSLGPFLVVAIVSRSAVAFEGIKLIGAPYRLYLGLRALVASRRPSTAEPTEPVPSRALTERGAFRQGLISNFANPKIAVLAARGRGLLTRPRPRLLLDRFSGVALIGLAARLAVERR
jgi:threonine/homoserine/homoserine lactone efflux protein